MVVATHASRQLGAFLRTQRRLAGLSAADAGRLLAVSGSTVSRHEQGQVGLCRSRLTAMLEHYGCAAARVDRAWELFADASRKPAAARLPAGTPKEFRKLVNAEREAVRERALSPYVVPGLLQHRRYAHALIATAKGPAAARALEVRLRRQRSLAGASPLRLHAVIDEAVLRRRIGGVEVLRDQLAHLLEMAARPNITVQVIPLTAGRSYSMNGSMVIIDYPEPDNLGVYLEYPGDGVWVDNRDEVVRYTTMFDDVTRLALTPAATTAHILDQVRTLSKR